MMPNEYNSELSPSKDIVEWLRSPHLATRESHEAANEIERLRKALRYYACDCKLDCRDDRMNKCGYEATEALGEKK